MFLIPTKSLDIVVTLCYYLGIRRQAGVFIRLPPSRGEELKITTKGRYGLKAIIDIAIATQREKCVNLRTIATTHGISDSYLEQIISQLKKAGLVVSTRGAQGGYLLSTGASEISVGDVLRVLEGSLSPVECVESGEAACGTGDCGSCSTKSVWGKMYSSVNTVVDSITLQDLVNDALQKGEETHE